MFSLRANCGLSLLTTKKNCCSDDHSLKRLLMSLLEIYHLECFGPNQYLIRNQTFSYLKGFYNYSVRHSTQLCLLGILSETQCQEKQREFLYITADPQLKGTKQCTPLPSKFNFVMLYHEANSYTTTLYQKEIRWMGLLSVPSIGITSKGSSCLFSGSSWGSFEENSQW